MEWGYRPRSEGPKSPDPLTTKKQTLAEIFFRGSFFLFFRRKRSAGEKRNPTTELDEKKIGGSSADRRSPHDLESWDDFVLGKRRTPGGDGHDMNFDDFLLGKRSRDNRFSDYDYSEFVLGKRP